MNIDLDQHFQKKKEEMSIHFESYIQPSMRGLPNHLLEKRNNALIALFFHFVSSIAGFSFYAIRKSRVYLVINVMSLILVLIGIYGVLTMSNYMTLTHGIVK